jgi:hypothetical protein
MDNRFEYKAAPCVRSGFCCKQVPCTHGSWNDAKTQCVHLVVTATLPNGAELHACGKYDEIVKTPGWEMYPAFGGGCGSTMFNHLRNKIFEGLRSEQNEQL